jgi:glycosyltransferase involved in cell wall biosynthesis
LKIALVTDTYFPRINGVSASTRVFFEEFEKLGHEVHLYAPAFPGHVDENPHIHRFPSMRVFFDPEDRLGRPNQDKELIRQFKEHRFDIVHTQTPFSIGGPAVKWAKESGAKVVHTYHTLFTAYVEYYLPWLPKPIMVWAAKAISRDYCNHCDLIITPSHEMKRVLETYGITHRPIEAIPTGINLARFQNADGARFRRDNGFAPEDQILLFMGRVSGEKNIAFLVRCMTRLASMFPKSKLVIAGEGGGKEGLRKMVRKLGLEKQVVFLGYLSGNDWRDCYASADLFTFASVTETQGLVVTEAMAAGVPVVAVGRMGVKDVMHEQRGGLLTDLDEDEFIEAVRRMLTDKELYALKKSETLPEAERWSSSSMAQKMLGAYEKLLKSN